MATHRRNFSSKSSSSSFGSGGFLPTSKVGRVGFGPAAGGADVDSISSKEESALVATESSKDQFKANDKALRVGWSSYAKNILCVNAYPNGITLSVHSNEIDSKLLEGLSGEVLTDAILRNGKFAPGQFNLRFRDTRDYQLAAGKYYLYKENYLQALEHHLSQLHHSGLLSQAVIFFGVTSDPFMSLHKKFDVTMACLELFENYTPGLLVIQTRSPMVVSALPLLKMLGDKVIVSIPVESRLESAIVRYTPGQPKISERLVAADGLKKQGVRVNLVAAPILPYGDFYRDAWEFAELLDRHSDYISIGCLASGHSAEESQLKTLPVAQKLVADNNLRLLRPHSYQNLYYALRIIAPKKLELPVEAPQKPSQLSLFAAA